MHMVLAAPGAGGKGAALDELVKFLNNHEHDLLRGKQTTSQTLGGWITDLETKAEQEQVLRDEIETKGRRANDAESIPKHVSSWCDLMRDYDELHGKKATAKVNSRYALPEHIPALGIELQKSEKLSFLHRYAQMPPAE